VIRSYYAYAIETEFCRWRLAATKEHQATVPLLAGVWKQAVGFVLASVVVNMNFLYKKMNFVLSLKFATMMQ
jgi:hypothetical protein